MFELAQAEQAENDEVYSFDGISILISPEVKTHLEADVIIDHMKNYGYVLKSSFEILTFGMKVNH